MKNYVNAECQVCGGSDRLLVREGQIVQHRHEKRGGYWVSLGWWLVPTTWPEHGTDSR